MLREKNFAPGITCSNGIRNTDHILTGGLHCLYSFYGERNEPKYDKGSYPLDLL
jgi:hypothetical protein